MKLMIASDIHGSASYARALLDAFSREGADKLLLLGDLLYHGARNDLPEGYDTKAVFAMLNEMKQVILAVRGNCDSEVDQMVLEFPMMADYALLDVDGQMVFATHGHAPSPDAPPPLSPGTLFLSGHTHVPCFVEKNGCMFANPGSVSIPKDGSAHGYMILHNDELIHKSLTGDEIARHPLGNRK